MTIPSKIIVDVYEKYIRKPIEYHSLRKGKQCVKCNSQFLIINKRNVFWSDEVVYLKEGALIHEGVYYKNRCKWAFLKERLLSYVIIKRE